MLAAEPTLLIFTLGPAADSRRRPFLPAPSSGVVRDLFAACLHEALAAGRGCGLALRVAGPAGLVPPAGVALAAPQCGNGFGERFRGAVDAAFRAGAAPLVVVGTDSPGLSPERVAGAVSLLADDADRVVLGPARDGGFYLLAASRPLDQELAATRFCRRDTLRRLRTALAAAGRTVVLLPALGDLDRQADFERFAGAGRAFGRRWRLLVRSLRALIRELARPPLPLAQPLTVPLAVPVRSGRAPPRG